jgi:hypothetical protein
LVRHPPVNACEVHRAGGESAFDMLLHQASLRWEGLANEANVSPGAGEPSERDAALAPRQALSVPSEAGRPAPAAVGIVPLLGGALAQRRIALLRKQS